MLEENQNIPQDEKVEQVQQVNNENTVPEQEKAGVLGIIASALFPIIGVIIYFVQRKEVRNPGTYLIAALVGFVLGFIMRAIGSAMY